MKLNQLILVLLTLSFLTSCEKDCNETYSITGRFYDITADTPYANAHVHLHYVEEKGYGHNDSKWLLKLLRTDKNGEFQVNYNCEPRADYIDAMYHMGNEYHILKRIPVNQNYNEELKLPSKGTIKLFLQSDNPVGVNNNDTLFLAFLDYIENNNYYYKIDTILFFENGLYETYRRQISPDFQMYYGRGSKNFNYRSSWGKHFYYKDEYIRKTMSGDPVIDEITIEY